MQVSKTTVILKLRVTIKNLEIKLTTFKMISTLVVEISQSRYLTPFTHICPKSGYIGVSMHIQPSTLQ